MASSVVRARWTAKSAVRSLPGRRYVHAIVRKSLTDAVRWGLVARNVADTAEPPSAKAAKAPPPRTWSAGELRAFLERVAEDRLYALWLTYATTGLRRGEALGIRWSALDLDAGQLSVRTERVVVAGVVHESEPKSARGLRTVALDARTVAALRAHRKRQPEERVAWGPAYEDDGLVFCRENGTVLHPSTVSKRFGQLVAGLDVPRVSLHGLRHTWASLALQAGVNPKVVSERLGHAAVAFTLDRYSHVMPGMQEDAAARVAALITDNARRA
jgi:integrase